jgi:Sec-independent protein translocase protein TatA
MLDNFGMGEFLMLAFFALLFFGPERLPQIGARVGRWLSQLTQYSKAFMTQWTEEAGAIQDAVQEVKGIRDEIRAAQVEISQSLNTARQDVVDTIDEARGSIQEATPTASAVLAASPPPALATAQETERAQRPAQTTPGNEDEAITKSQEIVDELLKKRGLIPESEVDEPGEEEQTGGDGAEPAVSATGTEEATEDETHLGNLAAAQEIVDRGAQRAAAKEVQRDEVDPQAAEDQETEQAAVEQESEAEPDPGAESVQEDEVQESAFDKTQRVLDRLMGNESEAPAAQEDASPEIGGVDTAAEEPTPATAPATSTDVQTDDVQHAKGLGAWVSFGQFSKLSIEVTQLRRELRALREELQGLHAQESSRDEAEQAASADGGSGQVALPVTEEGSEAVSMEEAA